MVDAVVFDLDDTLCEYRRSAGELLSISFDRVGAEQFFGVEEYYAVFDDHAEEAGDIEEIRKRCFAALSEENGRDPDLGRAVAREYSKERDQTAVDPIDGAESALDSLSSYSLALVTNGPPDMQSAKIDSLGFGEYFDQVVFAGFETAAKPDPEPFDVTLEALGVDADRAVHVGNSIASDVAGAKAAGMRAAWVPQDPEWGPADANGDPEPDYVFDSLHGLVDPPWQ